MAAKDTRSPLFSIIIPAYNAAAYVACALDSVFAQTLPAPSYEVILVDDCSTDDTSGACAPYGGHANFRMVSTARNAGPGIARNIGIDLADGQWILFLDSDDRLMPAALAELQQKISKADACGERFDVLGFNWAYLECSDSTAIPTVGLRKDHIYLEGGRSELLQRYLRLQTDGSVIFMAVRRSLLLQHRLRFDTGIHEDVDYLFYVYWYASAFCFVDKVLYGKVQRPDSIVNTISERHLHGFLRAWQAIGYFLTTQGIDRHDPLRVSFREGLIAVVATRVREISRSADTGTAPKLYRCLHDMCEALMADFEETLDFRSDSKYGMLARCFFDVMRLVDVSDVDKAQRIAAEAGDILKKSWACFDLLHSVFLGPDQIRTCCKRFFRDGEIQGDVVLMELGTEAESRVSSDQILAAKRSLYDAINKGEATDCQSCPFLEFKEWAPLKTLDIRYLSLEYHSVCNLKCSYCSETYYGGAKANYDVPSLVADLADGGRLDNCSTVVWGGGEPVVDASFAPLVEKLVGAVPKATHRVLTNSVKFSKVVAKLLTENRVSITTSVDAGSAETFELVRGRAKLRLVMSNLKKYVALQPRKVTVKYIFTEENSTLNEVQGFVDLVNSYQLAGCNFQISSNFKEEHVSVDSAVLMIAMHGLLMRAGHKAVFFDDLLRFRLGDIHAESSAEIYSRLSEIGLDGAVAHGEDYPNVVIWGAGWQARYLVEKSIFLKHTDIAFFVDNTPGKIGTQYFGRDVFSPDVLLSNDLPVVIAAVQGYPLIYDALRRLGVLESRLISGLIL